jgi:SPP1 family predicted phage head-tail adaptor
MIGAGQLKHRVVIQSFTTTQSQSGQVSRTYNTLATVWAKVTPTTGREYYQSDRINAEVTHQVTIRYRDDVKPDMRIIHRGRTFEIESVIDRREAITLLDLLCKEVVYG